MPTTTSPPILIWQPGGGVPGGPISNPPVYSQHDVTPLVAGQPYVDVVFGSVQTSEDWVLVECNVVNELDLAPLNIWPGIITDRTTAGFRLQLNGMPDSGNYYLHWAVSGVNILPVPATLYLFTGPTSADYGAATFTVRLPPSTTLASPITVTPDDGGAGGTFLPDSVVLSSGSASATFTYIAAAYGVATISVTNSGTLIDPASIVLTTNTPTYALSGPSGGDVGVASTNFTVLLAADVTLIAPATITPHDGGGGGTFTPTTVVLDTGSLPQHFTYTPASAGAKTISVTNSGGLTNPANLTYTAASAQHLLNTLISYWKMDAAPAGVTPDIQGSNHLTLHNSAGSVAGGIINNALVFNSATNDYVSAASNSSLQVTGSFTFSLWVKLYSQVSGTILQKGSGAAFDYTLAYDTTATGFYWTVASGPSGGSDFAFGGGLVANGVWTHIVLWYDSVGALVHIRFNDVTTFNSVTCPALIQTANQFVIGANGSPLAFSNCYVDEVGFWKRVLTAAEITALYNGGAGLPFSSFTA